MIIYNLHAVLNTLITAFVFGIVFMIVLAFSPDAWESDELMIFMAVSSATVVSFLTEIFGIRGRIFFMPMWLVGLVFSLAFAQENFGGTGVAAVLATSVGLFAMMMVGKKLRKKAEWHKAQKKLIECQKTGDPNQVAFWKQFKQAFFVPPKNKYDAHIHYHNYQCLELLKRLGVQSPGLDTLMDAYATNTHDGTKVKITDDQTDEIKQLIAERIKALQ